jgi:GTP pyrophosphokinase
VEILTSSELLEVDPDLENLCKTPKSRSAINKKLHQKRMTYAQRVGEQILVQELRRHGFSEDLLSGEDIHFVLEFLNIKDLQELLTRVGQDLLSPHLILYYLGPPSQALDDSAGQKAIKSLPFERNTLSVSELDKAIHKFARCCNPHPGQDEVVAILSERGITFHRGNCTDLLQKHDLKPQQFLNVAWDKDVVWRHPLTFHVHVLLEKLHSLLPALARTPPNILIEYLEGLMDKHGQPMVSLLVQLKDFSEAQLFFSCLPVNRASIEGYGREEGLRRLGTIGPEQTC